MRITTINQASKLGPTKTHACQSNDFVFKGDLTKAGKDMIEGTGANTPKVIDSGLTISSEVIDKLIEYAGEDYIPVGEKLPLPPPQIPPSLFMNDFQKTLARWKSIKKLVKAGVFD